MIQHYFETLCYIDSQTTTAMKALKSDAAKALLGDRVASGQLRSYLASLADASDADREPQPPVIVVRGANGRVVLRVTPVVVPKAA